MDEHNNEPRRRQGFGCWQDQFTGDMGRVASDMGRMAGEMGRMFSQFRPGGPSREAQDHFRNARLEFLKGLRQVIDEKIEKVQGRDRSRGTSVPVD